MSAPFVLNTNYHELNEFMATTREKIERFEIKWGKESDTPWRCFSYSRKWLKKQMNRFIRRQGKKVEPDDIGCKRGRKPLKGWEY